jgi:hypothetical protein
LLFTFERKRDKKEPEEKAIQSLKTGWKAAIRRAGIRYIRFHYHGPRYRHAPGRDIAPTVGRRGFPPRILRICSTERGVVLPPLSVALKYSTIFRVPILELFPSLEYATTTQIETRLAGLETFLGAQDGRRRGASATACKLEFLRMRKHNGEI